MIADTIDKFDTTRGCLDRIGAECPEMLRVLRRGSFWSVAIRAAEGEGLAAILAEYGPRLHKSGRVRSPAEQREVVRRLAARNAEIERGESPREKMRADRSGLSLFD